MEPTLIETLRQIDADDQARLDSLAEAVRLQGDRQARELISLAHGRDTALARKAFGVVLDLGPLAFHPLLDSLDPDKPALAVLELRHAVELAQTDRARLAATLDKLMDDKTPVPLPPQPANSEEKPAPRRLGDEAYLLLRRLLSPQESLDDHLLNARLFLDMEESQRDREIAKARESKRFTPLAEYFPSED